MLPHSDFYKLWQIGAQDRNYKINSPYPNTLPGSAIKLKAVNVAIKIHENFYSSLFLNTFLLILYLGKFRCKPFTQD